MVCRYDMDLYEKIYDWRNLLLAYHKASKGKRGRPAAAGFEYRLEDNLIDLHEELRKKSYRPGEYTSFYIHDPKMRLISAAPFRDRVVHHALTNLVEPVFEKSFIHDSYANRIGKGTHRAIDRAQFFSRRFKYVLPCDVRQYFPAIDHAILRKILSRKIREPDTLWLIDKILESGVGVLKEVYDMVYFPGDDLFAVNRPRGLPIGNLTSQFWANCYLNGFDHFAKKTLGCKGYLRYVDDILLFSNDKNQLWEWKKAVLHRMASLRLNIHERRAQVRPSNEGIPFLGFLVYPNKRRLKRRKGVAFSRKFRSRIREYYDGEISMNRLTASLRGWMNHAGQADTRGLQFSIILSALDSASCGVDHGGNTSFHKNL